MKNTTTIFLTALAIATSGHALLRPPKVLKKGELIEIADAAPAHVDFLSLKNGEKVEGECQELPQLEYSFALFSFDPSEISVASFFRTKQGIKGQYTTHDGYNYIGLVASEVLHFNHKQYDLNTIKYLVLESHPSSSVEESFYHLGFKNGDMLPVHLSRNEIKLYDGFSKKEIDTKDVCDLYLDGGVRGTLFVEGELEEMSRCYVADPTLSIIEAATEHPFEVSWADIYKLQKDKKNYFIERKPKDEIQKTAELEPLTQEELAYALNETSDEEESEAPLEQEEDKGDSEEPYEEPEKHNEVDQDEDESEEPYEEPEEYNEIDEDQEEEDSEEPYEEPEEYNEIDEDQEEEDSEEPYEEPEEYNEIDEDDSDDSYEEKELQKEKYGELQIENEELKKFVNTTVADLTEHVLNALPKQATLKYSEPPQVLVKEEVFITRQPFQKNYNYLPTSKRPAALITLPQLTIDAREVTNEEYRKFALSNHYPFPKHWDGSEGPDEPIANISYRDSKAYAEWANKRLPTYEEWVRAHQQPIASSTPYIYVEGISYKSPLKDVLGEVYNETFLSWGIIDSISPQHGPSPLASDRPDRPNPSTGIRLVQD